MKVNYPPYAVINLIHGIEERISFARELGRAAGAKTELFDVYDEVEASVLRLKQIIEDGNFVMDYANQLAESLNKVMSAFPRSYGTNERGTITLQDEGRPIFKQQQERDQPEIEQALHKFKTTATFFTKLDFLNSDLVIIGANGSGKTSLARHLTTHIKKNGILVSAQRVLNLPSYESIRSYATTEEHVKSIQLPDENLVTHHNLADEFGILVEHLLADDSRALKQNRSQRDAPFPPPTKLQVLLMMWNGLFSHLQLDLPNDINIEAKKESLAFHVSEMSEGEKVALFLIAHVLLCPENGFVIVDEPEMYLHPTIHRKLWDRLEYERSDAVFIYLTHDLDFASSRVTAKKLWLRAFSYPHQFELEEIPKNEIPQALLMELLGSRQDILFCEGKLGSLDEQIYSVLFPGYVIKPVEACTAVINFTKAFNKLPMSTRKAIGVIDRDYLPIRRIEFLKQEGVFALEVAHIENLLLHEALITKLANAINKDSLAHDLKRRVLQKLKTDAELEIAKSVSDRIDHYFKESHVRRGNSVDAIKANFDIFTREVDIDGWVSEDRKKINEIVQSNDYVGALKIYKNKGLVALANAVFGIKDFELRAVELLRRNKDVQDALRKYIPEFRSF